MYCRTCESELPEDEFYSSVQTKCKSCVKAQAKEYRKNNPDKARGRRREYKRKLRRKQGCRTREEIAATAQAKAAEKAAQKKTERRRRVWRELWFWDDRTDAEKYRDRYRNDPEFNLKERIRRQIRKAAKRDGISENIRQALRRNGSSKMVEILLGYTVAELKTHLERQFTKGMSWDAWRRGEIHIDHIVPQKAFDLGDDNEWRECWSLSNLQPLWAADNLRKRDAVEVLL